MRVYDIIEKKKHRLPLSEEEIRFFANGVASGEIPDYQAAALLMAICLCGMNEEETFFLTAAIAESGDTIDLSAFGEYTADKHSSGGVGDKTTLILAPIAASCGVIMAKMSGRGLGHTGGTVDKLESIRGYRTTLSSEEFCELVKKNGIAVIGQSGNLAPADKKLYALRDVTATIDSVPLIASSIMGKKLAAGAKTIVLDVKYGSGGFMKTPEQATALAETMVKIGKRYGRRVAALITNMDVPLGNAVGNALEVKEAIDVLSGRVTGPLLDVSLELGSRMLMLGGAAESASEAKEKLLDALHTGRGLHTLRQMIAAQGGDPSCCDDVSNLPQAKVIRPVPALQNGYVHHMDTVALGNTAQAMGAGRRTKEDVIDPSVGFVLHKRIGQAVSKGETIATVYAKDESSAAAAIEAIQQQVIVTGEQVPPCKLIHAFVTDTNVEKY